MPQHIVAMGGGGFSMEPDNLLLDEYVLKLTGKERPKVCFLPQASSESSIYVNNFYAAFTKMNAIPSWMSFFGRVPRNWRDTLLEQDVIYVGGGNTKSMLAIWRDWGADAILKEALENGTVLAGVSAGAICWFTACVTDSVWPLGAIPGLGFLKGSACPHYDGEPERRPTVLRMIKEGEIIPGIAIQDYAAAHYIDGQLHQVVASRPDKQAFYVSVEDGEAHEEALNVTYLGT